MKITVDSQGTLNSLAIVCQAALSAKDLNIAKAAVCIVEAASIEEPEKKEKKK